MSERFFVNRKLDSGESESAASITISGPEARHIAKVMRLAPGDQIILFDGNGFECRATITETGKKSVLLQPGDWLLVSRETSVSVTAAAALPKGDRLKFMIEKLTELGVARFIPLECHRSSVKARVNTIDKLKRYVIEASKQCGRNVLMDICEAVDVASLARMPADTCERYVCLPDSERSVREVATADSKTPSKMQKGLPNEFWLMVGPEGGFTDEEIEAITAAVWKPVNLGPRILRTETAIIASCAVALNL